MKCYFAALAIPKSITFGTAPPLPSSLWFASLGFFGKDSVVNPLPYVRSGNELVFGTEFNGGLS